ncbi:RNA polymerase sigma factor RpoS [Clostridium ragsdalei P11]|uniref:RNA polymerase sigma factor RpoS n=1 Tax=Clostridium ragsdalei P11 TaxID=1353534 RepID=A0A1A6AYM4_9CLOT|nr:sigma-70 family RNA polymerase sigma factor [Clostridium ragsdalei]OBR95147.1 RNA polymerase sigma factor RpoS [Clostridium ragsdalei P11]
MDADKREKVINELTEKYKWRGYLTEDEIIDCCTDTGLGLVDLDFVCDNIVLRGFIIRDTVEEKKENTEQNENKNDEDRSRTDYDILFRKIIQKYPSMWYIVKYISKIDPPKYREWKKLILEAQNNNKYARDRLIHMYLRNVLKLTYSFAEAYNCDFEECFNFGVIGLMRAIKKYDIISSDTFVRYFPWWIIQTMQRCCSIKNTVLYTPVHLNDKLFKFIIPIVKNQKILECSMEESFDYLEDLEDNNVIEDMKETGLLYGILPAYSYEDILSNEKLSDSFSDNGLFENKMIEKVFKDELKEKVNYYLGRLKQRERSVIIRRFGLEDDRKETLEEIANHLGVTKERIRQIEKKALNKLGRRLKKIIIY